MTIMAVLNHYAYVTEATELWRVSHAGKRCCKTVATWKPKHNIGFMQSLLHFCLLTLVAACYAPTQAADAKPVSSFEPERYMGTWYEIARLPNRYERGMTHITATYALRDDGRVDVINKNLELPKSRAGKKARQSVWFPDEKNIGKMRVRFFWPFSAPYVVTHLEPNYQWALVVSDAMTCAGCCTAMPPSLKTSASK